MRCKAGDLAYVSAPTGRDCNCFRGFIFKCIRETILPQNNNPAWEIEPPVRSCEHSFFLDKINAFADQVLTPIRDFPLNDLVEEREELHA